MCGVCGVCGVCVCVRKKEFVCECVCVRMWVFKCECDVCVSVSVCVSILSDYYVKVVLELVLIEC